MEISELSYHDNTINEYISMLQSLKDKNPTLQELLENVENTIKESSRDKNARFTKENNLVEREVSSNFFILYSCYVVAIIISLSKCDIDVI